MLQQTQVATVIPYYTRFMKAFPNVQQLAGARLDRVLQLWSGLGYYRRARYLHAAAQRMVADFGGEFPATLREACSLPGVGSYTAAAVLSIAYDAPLTVLDGNVGRIIARLDARAGSLAELAFREAVEARLESLLSWRHPGDFNQALMELGQTICLPRSPRCPSCPVRRWCRAHHLGQPEAFPSPRPRRPTERHYLAAAVISRPQERRDGKRRSLGASSAVLLVRGLDDGLMSDLWNFPSAFGRSPADARRHLAAKIAGLGAAFRLDSESRFEDASSDNTGSAGPGANCVGSELACFRHGVTYRDIEVRAYRVATGVTHHSGVRWLPLAAFRRAAVSELARKIAQAVSRSPVHEYSDSGPRVRRRQAENALDQI